MRMDGRKVRDLMTEELKEEILKIKKKLTLAVIQIGNRSDSNTYIKQKEKFLNELGIEFLLYKFDLEVSEEEIISLIDKLNKDEQITGIMIQLPIPLNFDFDVLRNRIHYKKDIDGMTDINIGKLVAGNKGLIPCTVLGIMKLLSYYEVNLSGANITILGRSLHIGRSLANLLINCDASISLCHSKTENLEYFTKNADIVISGVGKEKFLTVDMVKEGSIVVDVSCNYVDGKLCGDADFSKLIDKCMLITPVPGGVGPMTVLAVAENLLSAYKWQQSK